MSEVVRSNFCVFYMKLGAVYYPVACTKDITVTTSAETIERAPKLSSGWREYLYGKKTGTISGTGLVKVTAAPENLYTIFDVLGYQWDNQRILVKFSLTDPEDNLKVLEVDTIITEVSLAKSPGQIVAHSFSLLMSGPPMLSATPVENTNPEIQTFDYTAAGGETWIDLPFLTDNAYIVVAYINGVSREVKIAPDGYTGTQVQYDPVTKRMNLTEPLAPGDHFKLIYVDLAPEEEGDLIDLGDGDTLTDDGIDDIIL